MNNFSYCWNLSGESEPNNSEGQANGPLCDGKTYNAQATKPDDKFDWYSFNWNGQGTVHIDVRNFAPTGQVNLFYEAQANGLLEYDFDQGSGDYNVDYSGTGQSGKYLIMVFTPNPNDENYTIEVNTP
jgi:hypothetical protein